MGREGESVCPAIEFWCLPVTDDFLSSSVCTLLIHPMTIYSPALSVIKPNPIMSHFLWALFSFYEVQYVLDKSFLNPKCWETCVFPKSQHVPLVNCPANICKYSGNYGWAGCRLEICAKLPTLDAPGRGQTQTCPDPAFSRLVTVGAARCKFVEIVEHFKQSILLPSLPVPVAWPRYRHSAL